MSSLHAWDFAAVRYHSRPVEPSSNSGYGRYGPSAEVSSGHYRLPLALASSPTPGLPFEQRKSAAARSQLRRIAPRNLIHLWFVGQQRLTGS
jgi:hypothetical protein